MEDFLTVLKTRRSCRKFKADKVPCALVDKLLDAAIYAPTGMGSQSPVITVVDDAATIAKLEKLNAAVIGKAATPFYGAPIVLNIFVDTSAPTPEADGASITGALLLAATALGLGSCWINRAKEVFETEDGKSLVKKWGLKSTMRGYAHCVIGYADGKTEPAPRKKDYIVYDK